MTKIEKYFVIVCEESYLHSIRKSEWDKYLNAKKVQIVNDARNRGESFIWNEEWVVMDGDYSLYESLHSLVGRECLIMTRTLIKEWNTTPEEMQANLIRRIREADTVKVTGIIDQVGKAYDAENRRLRKENEKLENNLAWTEYIGKGPEHLGDA